MKHTSAKGFTLVELMISLVLGLVVIGGVVSVMLANSRSYNTNEGLAEVQESARSAFELLARDIRQSAGNGCDNTTGMANVLGASTAWWRDWYGLRGFDGTETDSAVADGTTVGLRIAGTDSIHTQGLDGVALAVDTHTTATGLIKINAASIPFVKFDTMLICDFDHAAIFQVSGYTAPNTVAHLNFSGSPGNCQKGLGFPATCATTTGIAYAFPRNSQIGKLAATAWYVGANGRTNDSGRSLYRRRLTTNGVVVVEEVVAGVVDLEIKYGTNNSDLVRDATAITAASDWDKINSIFIKLTADSADKNVSTDNSANNGRIRRPFTYLITLRNRVL